MAVDIESLYRAYGPLVLRRCRRLLRDEEKALDAMHDVFVEILRRRERLDARGLGSFFQRVATNVCLNRLRSERRHPEDRDEALLLEIATQVEDAPESRALARGIFAWLFSGTPQSTQIIAVLHYVDGLTLQEVAAEVGLSVSGVRKRLRGLKERLPALELRDAGTNREPRDA
jgi:RNA polymerase sigma-70 factor (ECF subfamily)